MDGKFIMNIVMPDRISSGLETVVELLRPSMLYSDQVILNCSELNELADAYNKYGDVNITVRQSRQSGMVVLKIQTGGSKSPGIITKEIERSPYHGL